LCKECCSSNFGQKKVAQFIEELDSRTKKETKNGWKEGQRNTNMEKEVTTEQEQQSM
jgi:hypothetical protein